MAEDRSGPGRWIAGLLGRRGSPPPHAGRASVTTGEDAVVAAEALAADAVCRASAGGALPRGPNAFGRVPQACDRDAPDAALGEAVGLALTGLRAAAMVPADALTELRPALAGAAARSVPLVVHAAVSDVPDHGGGTGSGHGGYHALADTGAFLALPRDAQEAADLTLVARRLAELALAPGVLVQDGRETAWAARPASLADAELVRAYLGDPGDTVECPTPAQALLFGDRRRRVLRWFDPDRPIAHGVAPRGADLAAAVEGRRRFFADSLGELARRAMAELADLTGRPLGVTRQHLLQDARHALVAQGSAVELAEAVATTLRGSRRERVGVLGISWLRPFPVEEITAALAHVETVTVLERTADGLSGRPPLARELLAAGAVGPDRLVSAMHGPGAQPLTAASIAAALEEATRGGRRRASFRIGVALPDDDDRHPKRQALLQRLRRDHPELGEGLLAAGQPLDVRPVGARTVTFAAFRPDAERLAVRLGRALSEAVGPEVIVRGLPAEPDCVRLVATAAPDALADPGDGVPAELALTVGLDAPAALAPAELLAPGGTLAACSAEPVEDAWEQLPAPWRATLRDRGARLVLVPGGVGELLAAVGPLLAGQPVGTEVRPAERSEDPAPEPEPALPLAVRRFQRTGETHDNVARYWGEVARPRLDGAGPVPDPYLALGTVPPATATFHDMTAERATVPLVSADRCTGCGACWTACPDSSIAPTAVSVEAILRVAAAAAAAEPGPPDPALARLQRALPKIGARVQSRLAKERAGSLSRERVVEAAAWVTDRLELDEAEREAMPAAIERLAARCCRAPLAVTPPFFGAGDARGARELLALAVNPQSCQGCGGCAEVCPADAIDIEPQRSEHVTALAEAWRDWELLPDTQGATLARVADEIGPLAALLLSRHVFFAVAGGDGAEPGSGERLAVRQVAAVVEARAQREALALLQELDELSEGLADALRTALSASVDVADLDAVEGALREPAPTEGALRDELVAAGAAGAVDRRRARALARAAREVAELRACVAEGPTGVGRSRFALVVTGATAGWAASFPRNPFSVPVALDLAGSGPDLATGLLRGLRERTEAEARLVDAARELLPGRGDDTQTTVPLPTLLLLGDVASLVGAEAAGLSRLLGSGLPVKVLLLDDGLPVGGRVDPVLLALAHRHAFVLSGSVAHERHLHDGVEAALSFEGPALVRVFAPSPRRDGHATERTVERARDAVRSRALPLVRYDPRAGGVFGTRLSLEGNPEPEATWARDADGRAVTPAHWALGASRHAESFTPCEGEGCDVAAEEWMRLPPGARGGRRCVVDGPDGRRLAVAPALAAWMVERAEAWATLQELAGLVTPFTEAVRRRADEEAGARQAAELDALRGEHERALDEAVRGARAGDVQRLTEQLLRLAGTGGGRRTEP